jgi:hypothetical protein
MSISGTYYLRKRMPHPELLMTGKMPTSPMPEPAPSPVPLKDHGPVTPGFFEGEVTLTLQAQPDGTLTGTAGKEAILSGYYTGDQFFTVEYRVGPGAWVVCAQVYPDGSVEGMISAGSGQGKQGSYPNLAYGRKL